MVLGFHNIGCWGAKALKDLGIEVLGCWGMTIPGYWGAGGGIAWGIGVLGCQNVEVLGGDRVLGLQDTGVLWYH